MKRIFDLVASLFLLSLAAAPLLIIYFLCKIQFGRGFFVQERAGRYGKIFRLYKFNSMLDLKDDRGVLLPDEQRLTKFGKFIRKTSLDELPELLNVICGDMSLVGPRPFLAEYLSLYSQEQMRRHEVKPGITGWAQVNGRNQVDWEERLKLDVWYVDHRSLFLDLKILGMTVAAVLKSDGVSAKDHATMPKFKGSVS